MFCTKCGKQISEGSKFCNFCGAPVEAPAPRMTEPVIPETPAAEPTSVAGKPVFEEFNWQVNDYPSANTIRKTEDINFDWNADPSDIKDRYTRGLSMEEEAELKVKAELAANEAPAARHELSVEDVFPVEPAKESPAAEIEKFYTFSKKNEEFQQLLNREYDKIKTGNPIGQEQSEADRSAERKFEERPKDTSMEAFLEREGAVRSYEPKAFESDVLEKIEAQERAKEEARLEKEARQAALEEARRKAEEEMKLAEEARLKVEEARQAAIEEARLKAEEEARMKAITEAKAKAEEEARLAEKEAARAEEEMRLRALEEERAREDEAAAKRREEEEEKRRAEAEYRAFQEAQKIREQREARQATLEEERRKAEEERRNIEAANIRNRLANEQKNLEMQANSDRAAEAVRTALEHTARMKAEEEAMIKAEIAKLRGEAFRKPVISETPAVVEQAEAEPVMPAKKETPVMPEKPVAAEAPVIAEQPASADDAKREADMRAHQAHQDNLSEMAKAREAFLAEFGLNSEPQKTAPKEGHIPATVEELLEEKPVTGRDTMLDNSDLVNTRTIDKAAVLAGMGATVRISKSELKEIEDSLHEIPSALAEPELSLKEEPATVEDLLNQFTEASVGETEEAAPAMEADEAAVQEAEPVLQGNAPQEEQPTQQPEEGFAIKEEPAVVPAEGAEQAVKPGLEDTMVMPPTNVEDAFIDSFNDYGKKEADELKRIQVEEASAPAPEGDMEQVNADSEAEEVEEKGGAGRIVLKILLIILIIIFAVELAGIGVKFLAPNSAATKFIDNQLNKVIHLITGSVTDYSIPGTDYEV